MIEEIDPNQLRLIQHPAHRAEMKRCAPFSVTLSTAWHLVQGRNAWHGSWSSTYRPRHFSTLKDTLQSIAEKEQVQGTVFYIFSAPMIVFACANASFGTTVVNERKIESYSVLLNEISRTKPIESLHKLNGDWLRTFAIRERSTIRDGFLSEAWASSSLGSKYSLHWETLENREYEGFLFFVHNILT